MMGTTLAELFVRAAVGLPSDSAPVPAAVDVIRNVIATATLYDSDGESMDVLNLHEDIIAALRRAGFAIIHRSKIEHIEREIQRTRCISGEVVFDLDVMKQG